MSKQETVEITLTLPKAIVDFLKSMNVDVEEYIIHNVIGVIAADLEADTFYCPKELVEKHSLMPVFREFNISVSSYVNPEA